MDKELTCSECGTVLDATESCGKLIGCELCDAVQCSANCAEKHTHQRTEKRFYPIRWLHFDNDRRFRIFSDNDGHYKICDMKKYGLVVLETIAADHAAMKCNEFNSSKKRA